MPLAFLYLLFFCSGASSLIYQVVWVREFGNVFGATIYSTSLVVALFMLGLGSGSYLVGRWADRRYVRAPDSLLRAYGLVEFLIAGLGLAISLTLPHFHALGALSSSYVVDSAGWFVLSPLSYAAQGAIALGVLGPITLLMGGTLTLLVRHRVRADVERAGANAGQDDRQDQREHGAKTAEEQVEVAQPEDLHPHCGKPCERQRHARPGDLTMPSPHVCRQRLESDRPPPI